MSTRWARRTRAGLADEVAAVACDQRELLLRAHRFRLRREDLEDCYSQATLELLAQALSGGTFASRRHIANVIELRFLSRVRDRRRALSGRSPMLAALEQAAPLDPAAESGVDVLDESAAVERLVLLREELRELERLARELTADQRLALASQLAGESVGAFCRRSGWSPEKYRKVGQRARLRLRDLRDLRDEFDIRVSDRRRPVGEGIGTDL
ncbi:MAG TPA: hypothetical protein VF706_06450 [Solirubrobacteraceae bacterium]